MMLPDLKDRLTARTPNGRRPQMMWQRWESLLFLHWPCPAALIQPALPPGLTVDRFEDQAWIGIVPLYMRKIRPVGCPPVPWLSCFLELNVRTYVHDRNGVPGIWFYSLDCNQPVAVWLARTLMHLPYMHAALASKRSGWVDFESRRLGTQDPARYRYRGIGEPREAAPGSLEFFLIERYYLYAFSRRSRRLIRGQIHHRPYSYRTAELEAFSTLPARLDGLPELQGAPAHQCVAEELDVKIYGTETVGL
jgi:uncharacterized protein YqjF (DUF2071 family)